MSADGVSIQTSIAQAVAAARTQAKVQNKAKEKPPVSNLLENSKDTRVEKAKETDEAAKGRVDEEREEGRRRDQDGHAGDEHERDENAENAADGVGLVVDTRA